MSLVGLALPISRATLRKIGGGGDSSGKSAIAAGANALGMGGLTGNTLECKFNPQSLTRKKSSKWRGMPGKAPADTPGQTDLQYVGIGEDSLQTMLLFDDTAGLGLSNLAGALSGKKSVKACTNQLLNWLTIEDGEPKKQPATLEFAWGTGLTFVGVLVDVTVQFLMFDTKGEPTRATASITMYAKNDRTKGTNPTSGGLPGRTSAQVQEGDTLASISYRQYGDPNLWRAIAASNDIDDPTRVPIGSRLLVPSRRDALAFSAREHLDG